MVTAPPEGATVLDEEDGFIIRIDFDRGAPDPARVFRAIDGIITAIDGLDRTLLDSVSREIETVLVLADVRAGSIWVNLKNVLRTVDEGALAKLEWKQILGHYLVAGRNALIAFGDQVEQTGIRPSFAELRRHFFELAQGTELKKMGDYSPPSAEGMVKSAAGLDHAVRRLAPRDRVSVETGGQVIDLRPGIDWTPDLIADLTTSETIHLPPSQMILIVKRPDYLSHAQWEFRHGKKTIRAKIEDEAWLQRFLAREIIIRPGDALRCMVAASVTYGLDHEPAGESHVIRTVLGIVEDEIHRETADLFARQPGEGDL